MRTRETPLPDPPHRMPWVRVSIAGWEDPLVLRVPSAGRWIRLAQPWDDAAGKEDLAGLEDAGAAIIAAMWADPLREIVANKKDPASVWEELHEDGWTIGAVSSLIEAVARKVGDSTPLEVEVADLVGFTGPGERIEHTA